MVKIKKVATIVEQAPINFVGYYPNNQTAVRLDFSQTSLFGKIMTLKLIGTKYEYYNSEWFKELNGKIVEYSYDGLDEYGNIVNPKFITII